MVTNLDKFNDILRKVKAYILSIRVEQDENEVYAKFVDSDFRIKLVDVSFHFNDFLDFDPKCLQYELKEDIYAEVLDTYASISVILKRNSYLEAASQNMFWVLLHVSKLQYLLSAYKFKVGYDYYLLNFSMLKETQTFFEKQLDFYLNSFNFFPYQERLLLVNHPELQEELNQELQKHHLEFQRYIDDTMVLRSTSEMGNYFFKRRRANPSLELLQLNPYWTDLDPAIRKLLSDLYLNRDQPVSWSEFLNFMSHKEAEDRPSFLQGLFRMYGEFSQLLMAPTLRDVVLYLNTFKKVFQKIRELVLRLPSYSNILSLEPLGEEISDITIYCIDRDVISLKYHTDIYEYLEAEVTPVVVFGDLQVEVDSASGKLVIKDPSNLIMSKGGSNYDVSLVLLKLLDYLNTNFKYEMLEKSAD